MANNTTLTPVRITKAMKFSAIISMLNGECDVHTFQAENHVPVDFGKTDAVEFLNAEIALLGRKNAGERKQTATQRDNEMYKAMIVRFLMDKDSEDFQGCTCSEILKGIDALSEFSNQKIAALCNQLEKGGYLVKSAIKGKSYFRATEDGKEGV